MSKCKDDLFDGDGVHVIPEFISSAECDELRKIVGEYEPDHLGSVRCLFDKSPIFQTIVSDNRLSTICGETFAIDYRLSALGARVIKPAQHIAGQHMHVQSPHIDYPYRYVIDSVEGSSSPYYGIPLGLQVLIPLVDLNIENGATAYIPGSQKWHRHPVREEFNQYIESGRVKRLEIKAGSAALWAGPLWHCAMQNHSENNRSVITMMFAPMFVNHPDLMRDMYSKEFLSGLPSDIRRLLSLDDTFGARTFDQPKRTKRP